MSVSLPVPQPLVRFGRGLAVRDFRLLWSSGVLTYLGDWMDQVSLSWLVLTLTDSPLYVGLLQGCRFLPLLVFGIWGGVLADSVDRRKLLLWSQGASLFVTLGLAVAAFQAAPPLWLIFALAIARGSLLSFDRPARHALVPTLVPKDALVNAVALQSLANNSSRVLGPALAGLLIALVGAPWCLLVTALLFVPSLAALLLLSPAPSAAVTPRGGVKSGMGDAFTYAVRDPLISATLGATALVMLLLVPYFSLLPVIARDVLNVGAAEFGFLNAAAGVGSFLGAGAIAWVGSAGVHRGVVFGSAAAFGVTVIAFAGSASAVLSMVLLVLVGLTSQVFFTSSNAAIQADVPDELRGRVLSIYLLDRAVMPLGSLLAGALATTWGAPTALAVLAATGVAGVAVLAARALDGSRGDARVATASPR